MYKAISYLHLTGCIGWTIFIAVIGLSEPEDFLTPTGIIATLCVLITAFSGITLFISGKNRELTKLGKIIHENKVLENRIKQAELNKKLEKVLTTQSS